MSRIKLSPEFADEVKQSLVNYIVDNRREKDNKIHVSDLLAPRFAFFNISEGREMRPDDIDMFIPGVAFHELIQKAMGSQYAEQVVKLEDIVGHIDILMAAVVEIKTSRKYTIPEIPDDHYLKQAKYYMVLSARKEGYIVVVYFTAGRNPWKKKASTLEVIAWNIIMSSEELERTKEEMLETQSYIKSALKKGDFENLPLCEVWRCGQAYKGEVTRLCQFYDKCQPEGRFPEKELLKVIK